MIVDRQTPLAGFFLPHVEAQVQADVRAFMAAARAAAGLPDVLGLAVFCDGEAAAVLWCRHHPEPVCGDYTRRIGREYRRRRRARARRRR